MKSANALLSLAILAFSGVALATPCESYATLDNPRVLKTVEPASMELSNSEKGMIQTVILVGNPSQPMSLAKSIAQFTDADSGGSNGGSLVYSEVKIGERKHTIVRATYYPGDNEYGALFQIYKTAQGDYATFIGTVGDGDISCLSYVNVE